jgi:hypothetical protein
MTNREAINLGLTPCECDPNSGGVSFVFDEFHAQAVITVQRPIMTKSLEAINGDSTKHENLVHACFDCATKYFKNCCVWQAGVVWTK